MVFIFILPLKPFLAIGLYDESAQDIQINRWNLRFFDRNLQRRYDFEKKDVSIKYSKVFLAVGLFIFFIYVAVNIFFSSQSSFIMYGTFLCVGIITFFFMGSNKYKKYHYKFLSGMLGMTVILKIFFDFWIFTNYGVCLSEIVVQLLLCLTIHLKINFFHILMYTLFLLISFSFK